jgi:uncharacterized membrane protein YsdA (DUF1294 family)
VSVPETTLLLSAFALINLWTFMLFGFDKLRAEAGHWRIAESTLLGLAFMGGSIGAMLGRRMFRHKTRKQPFSSQLDGIVWLHMIAAGLAGGWMLA